MALRRRRALLVSVVTFAATSALACSAVLGLDPPTLDPCADGGCGDAGPPVIEAGGSSSGGDTSSPLDGAAGDEAPAPSLDSGIDAGLNHDASEGVRCGSGASAIFCVGSAPECCLTFDDAGNADYSCQASPAACPGYPIECATNNDCPGSKVCCFYHSGIKCEDESTPSCANVLVCDPSGPSDQCPSGSTCSIAYVDTDAGYTLPYFGCSQ